MHFLARWENIKKKEKEGSKRRSVKHTFLKKEPDPKEFPSHFLREIL
jgi:hypothetical protein